MSPDNEHLDLSPHFNRCKVLVIVKCLEENVERGGPRNIPWLTQARVLLAIFRFYNTYFDPNFCHLPSVSFLLYLVLMFPPLHMYFPNISPLCLINGQPLC